MCCVFVFECVWCVCLHRGQCGRYYVYAVLSKRSPPLRSFLLRRSTASDIAFFTAELLPYLPPLGMSAAGIVSRVYICVLQRVCISYVHRSHSSHHFTTPTHTNIYNTHTHIHTHQHTPTPTHTHTNTHTHTKVHLACQLPEPLHARWQAAAEKETVKSPFLT